MSKRGFTILEVLIATVVLSIGLTGILVLLSASAKVAGETVEDGVAASLARSVHASLLEGSQRRAFLVREGGQDVRGFVFVHEGVKNRTPGTGDPFAPPAVPTSPVAPDAAKKLALLRASDFAIFLPRTDDAVFVFPRPGGALGVGPFEDNRKETDNFLPAPDAGHLAPVFHDVRDVYALKNRPAHTSGLPRPADLSQQYGFALAVRRAAVPSPTDQGKLARTDGLYEVQIWVYREFDAAVTSPHHVPVPGGSSTVYLAVGP